MIEADRRWALDETARKMVVLHDRLREAATGARSRDGLLPQQSPLKLTSRSGRFRGFWTRVNSACKQITDEKKLV